LVDFHQQRSTSVNTDDAPPDGRGAMAGGRRPGYPRIQAAAQAA